MIQVFKLLNDIYDNSLPNLLMLSATDLRGHKDKLFIEGSNKDLRKHFFTRRICKVWNSLPPSVVGAKDVKSFEGALDRYWCNQEILYDFKANIKV